MSRPLRVAVIGAAGRMGKLLVDAVDAADDLILAARVDLPASPEGGMEGSGLRTQRSTFEFLASGVDVAVEFTAGGAPAEIGPELTRLGCAWVCGTTGLTEASEGALRTAAAKVPVLWSPNMSLGALLLHRFARMAAHVLPPDWVLEITEAHHSAKLDAPSGTALSLARAWTEERGGEAVHGRSGRTGPRPPSEVGIHSLRLPEQVGEHRLLLGGQYEAMELAHQARDRRAFVSGALEAARWLTARPPAFYTLDDWAGERWG